ncbi:hypothetical protein BB561_005835 [Smittium simulii]|uniref:Uncharacterized protein n=1 Tax=Smittium simulii TaxID=133385 RepID=A0A2T9Y7Z9_9FUNG|nr:hypothetical protein BB561_005835 [Smittium simulii]
MDSFLTSLQYMSNPIKDASINSVKFDSSGDYLFLAGQDRLIYLLNSNNGKVFTSEQSSKRFASCGGDKTVFLWDIERGDIPRKYGGHTMRINTVCMNQEGSLLLSGSYDTTVRIFDLRARQRSSVQVLDDAKDSISSVFINQHQIISGSVDGYVRTYDIRSGQKILDCISEAVTCVTETSDSNCLLASSLDNKIRLIDKSNGSLLNTQVLIGF